jgi:hypothetical protein
LLRICVSISAIKIFAKATAILVKKDIQAVKQKAELGFLSALAKFNHRRLERQKNKLR